MKFLLSLMLALTLLLGGSTPAAQAGNGIRYTGDCYAGYRCGAAIYVGSLAYEYVVFSYQSCDWEMGCTQYTYVGLVNNPLPGGRIENVYAPSYGAAYVYAVQVLDYDPNSYIVGVWNAGP